MTHAPECSTEELMMPVCGACEGLRVCRLSDVRAQLSEGLITTHYVTDITRPSPLISKYDSDVLFQKQIKHAQICTTVHHRVWPNKTMTRATQKSQIHGIQGRHVCNEFCHLR